MDEKKRGEVRVADHVIAVIAGAAAQEVPGIQLRSGGLYQDIARRVGGAQLGKGISVQLVEEEVRLELRVAVAYGMQIHQVCHSLQEKVKEQVEHLTGLQVEEVNVRVEALDGK